MLREIIIICPGCQNEFEEFNIVSINSSFKRQLEKEELSGFKKCPKCGKMVDIREKNWTWKPVTFWEKLRKFINRFTP